MSWQHITWFNYCLLLFGIGWACTGIYRRHALNKGYVDMPNVRSAHSTVTARGGGIVFSMLWLALLGYAFYSQWCRPVVFYSFLPAALVALIGFRDDMKSVSPIIRLLVQALACGISLYFIRLPAPPLFGFTLPEFAGIPWHSVLMVAIYMLCVLWMTNLMNFMDGTDGLCGTQAVIVLGFAGIMFLQIGGYSLAVLSFGACALILGFLVWNWPSANIFMGDSGSGFLGFLIAIMALVSHKWYKIPYELWLILTAPFWFDATVTLLRRMLHRDPWTQPHSLHAYQRLTHVGWSHLKVLIAFTLLNAAMVSMAWVSFQEPKYTYMMLLLSIALCGILYLLVEIYKPMYKTWHPKKPK